MNTQRSQNLDGQPQIYTEGYYRLLNEVEERHWWCRGMRSIIEALMEPFFETAKDWRVLDAGCGAGYVLDWLREKGVSGFDAGFDLSPHALKYCKARGQDRIALASILELPYADKSFDFVISINVLQHLPLPEGDTKAVSECLRVLKPGGLLLIQTNSKRIDNSDEQEVENFRRYTVERLGQIVTDAGFEIERLTYVDRLDFYRERLRRLRPKLTTNGAASRSSGEEAPQKGLPLRLPPPHLNWAANILTGLMKAEARGLRKPGKTQSIGNSTMAVARRPV